MFIPQALQKDGHNEFLSVQFTPTLLKYCWYFVGEPRNLMKYNRLQQDVKTPGNTQQNSSELLQCKKCNSISSWGTLFYKLSTMLLRGELHNLKLFQINTVAWNRREVRDTNLSHLDTYPGKAIGMFGVFPILLRHYAKKVCPHFLLSAYEWAWETQTYSLNKSLNTNKLYLLLTLKDQRTTKSTTQKTDLLWTQHYKPNRICMKSIHHWAGVNLLLSQHTTQNQRASVVTLSGLQQKKNTQLQLSAGTDFV